MGGQGTTAVHALGTIDRKSLPAIEDLVDSVYSKMNLGLDNKQIWDKFIGESGSNLIYKYLNIYLDTVTLGGPPERLTERMKQEKALWGPIVKSADIKLQ